MLLDTKGDERPSVHRLSLFAKAVAVLLVASGVITFLTHLRLETPGVGDVPAVGASLKLYAVQLFTTYLLPVQIIGFLLLIAMLGVIVLSKKFEGLDDIK
jgi:NADH-quinone oxidoreductase subunit J